MLFTKVCELLLLCTATVGAQADPGRIVGEWRGVAGPERLIFRADGLVRTCFGSSKAKGNAAIGSWKELQPGRFRVVFTHAGPADCDAAPNPTRKYQVEILGFATATAGAPTKAAEVALFVSGEGPPDRYARAGSAASEH